MLSCSLICNSPMKRCTTEVWFARALQQWVDVLRAHHRLSGVRARNLSGHRIRTPERWSSQRHSPGMGRLLHGGWDGEMRASIEVRGRLHRRATRRIKHCDRSPADGRPKWREQFEDEDDGERREQAAAGATRTRSGSAIVQRVRHAHVSRAYCRRLASLLATQD